MAEEPLGAGTDRERPAMKIDAAALGEQIAGRDEPGETGAHHHDVDIHRARTLVGPDGVLTGVVA